MDLSQRSMELNQHLQDQLSHQLQNFQSSMRTSFEHQETLRQMGQIGGLGETMIKQETQPYYQTMLPPIKLEPGLGLGKLVYITNICIGGSRGG